MTLNNEHTAGNGLPGDFDLYYQSILDKPRWPSLYTHVLYGLVGCSMATHLCNLLNVINDDSAVVPLYLKAEKVEQYHFIGVSTPLLLWNHHRILTIIYGIRTLIKRTDGYDRVYKDLNIGHKDP